MGDAGEGLGHAQLAAPLVEAHAGLGSEQACQRPHRGAGNRREAIKISWIRGIGNQSRGDPGQPGIAAGGQGQGVSPGSADLM